MAGLGDLFQKAVYLGVGLACYTGEKASERLGELRGQAQKLADELVQRGEMTTEEARKMVDDMVQRSQQEAEATRDRVQQGQGGPRTIEIEVEDSYKNRPQTWRDRYIDKYIDNPGEIQS